MNKKNIKADLKDWTQIIIFSAIGMGMVYHLNSTLNEKFGGNDTNKPKTERTDVVRKSNVPNDTVRFSNARQR